MSNPDLPKLADLIEKRGLGLPAIFLLEMYKPLVGLAQNFSLVSAPLLIPLFGLNLYNQALKLLDNPANVEELILLIEAKNSNNCK